MNLDEIKKLIKLVEKSNISELEIEEDGSKIKVIKSSNAQMVAAPQVVALPAAPVVAAHAVAAPVAAAPVAEAAAVADEDDSHLHIVTSPMVGTFYNASSPDSAPYVSVGDLVRKGQTLCIIEAMKLMNEIEAEVSGTIASICIESGEPAEYGAALFKIDPS